MASFVAALSAAFLATRARVCVCVQCSAPSALFSMSKIPNGYVWRLKIRRKKWKNKKTWPKTALRTNHFTLTLPALIRLAAVIRGVCPLVSNFIPHCTLVSLQTLKTKLLCFFFRASASVHAEHVLAPWCGDGRDIAQNRDIVFDHETFTLCHIISFSAAYQIFSRHSMRSFSTLHTNHKLVRGMPSEDLIFRRIFDQIKCKTEMAINR